MNRRDILKGILSIPVISSLARVIQSKDVQSVKAKPNKPVDRIYVSGELEMSEEMRRELREELGYPSDCR